MKILKGLLATVLLIGLIFLGFYIGIKFGAIAATNDSKPISNISKENMSFENTTQSNTSINLEDREPKTQDFSGKWNTVSAVDTSTWNTIDNLTEIFGSSFLTYGSYLQLNSDNTFLDAIYPITSNESSTTGTYSIQNDYYQVGDSVIILNYSDGKQYIFKIIYEEENVPLLMQDISNGEPYQFNLEKK